VGEVWKAPSRKGEEKRPLERALPQFVPLNLISVRGGTKNGEVIGVKIRKEGEEVVKEQREEEKRSRRSKEIGYLQQKGGSVPY